ncbi:TFPI2 isoform 2, partial [Pan troglodytes]
EACDEACWRIEKVPKVCRLQVSVDDQCEGSTEKYFFNLSSMTCEKFFSGGCHRNRIENRFPDEATCMGFCAPKKNTEPVMLSPILAVEGMTITLLAGRIANVHVQKL